jgi:hypothetical protein
MRVLERIINIKRNHQMLWLVAMVMVAVSILGSDATAVTVLTFDDIGTPTNGESIPDGYGGLHWSEFGYQSCSRNSGGYNNGCVSGDYIAYNFGGDPAKVVADGSFDFIGAYLTAAWRIGLNITVEGYRDGMLVHSQTVVVDYYGPTWFGFNFMNIDKVRFNSYGGTEAPGLSGDGTHFVMDNFTIPEPTTILLLGLGGILLRRKIRNQK